MMMFRHNAQKRQHHHGGSLNSSYGGGENRASFLGIGGGGNSAAAGLPTTVADQNKKTGFAALRASITQSLTSAAATGRRHSTGVAGSMNGVNGGGNYYTTTDGSAKSIHVPIPLVQSWRRTAVSLKIIAGLVLLFFTMAVLGYRHLRWSAGSLWLDCDVHVCHLQLTESRSWAKTISLRFPRRQFTEVHSVKCSDRGVMTSKNPDLSEPFGGSVAQQEFAAAKKNKHAKHAKAKANYAAMNYKGPDEDGHYLSYALLFRQKEDFAVADPEPEQPDNNGDATIMLEDQDLSVLAKYADAYRPPPLYSPRVSDDGRSYRLVLRRFGVTQSKRRVRMMVQKVDSYVRFRRQKLVVKESSAPSWQGLVGIIVGLIGFLITLLIGTIFYEDEHYPTNPRYPYNSSHHRHSSSRHNKTKRKTSTSTSTRRSSAPSSSSSSGKYNYRRTPATKQQTPHGVVTAPQKKKLDESIYNEIQTPARYEVSTVPNPGTAAKQKKSTTTISGSSHHRSTAASATAATTRQRRGGGPAPQSSSGR